MGYVSAANMAVSTNGRRDLTFYNVTSGPAGGQIHVSDTRASVFSQINVDREEVVYVQTNMSLAADSFRCTVSNQVRCRGREVQFEGTLWFRNCSYVHTEVKV